MLNSILINFTQVESILNDRKEVFYLDNINRTILIEICSILTIFKTGSEVLSGDEFPTMHLVIPFLKKFQDCCEAQPGETSATKEFKRILLEKLEDKIWLSDFHYIATFLHPETKTLNVSITCFLFKYKFKKIFFFLFLSH